MSPASMIAKFVAHTALAAAAVLTVLLLSVLALVFTLLAGAPLKRLAA